MTQEHTPRRPPAKALAIAAGVLVLTILGATAPYLLGALSLRTSVWGIPESSSDVQSLLLISRVLWRILAVAMIGLLLAAACLVPSPRAGMSAAAARAKSVAVPTALLASAAAIAVAVLSAADSYVLPLQRALLPPGSWDYAVQSPQGKAWLASAALALAGAITAAASRRVVEAWVALALAIASVLPPVLVGHAASAGNHDLVTSALLLHVGASSLWIGGLLGLVWVATTNPTHEQLVTTASRFSALALPLFVVVGLTGLANAAYRLGIDQLASSAYGALVALKVLAFVLLGTVGFIQRRLSLRQLASGNESSLRRLILIETGILALTLGLSGALASTAPPSGSDFSPSAAEVVIGFPIPPSPSWLAISTGWRFDVLVLTALGVASLLYGIGVYRLRGRGDRWPIGRTAAWYAGIALVAIGTLSGLASYGRVSFTFHMVQHMTLSMIAPLLLTLASPITMALRAMPPAKRDDASGPREWLVAALHSRPVKVLTHPLTALALFITAPYVVYFSGIFEFAMRNHWAHLLMQAHFVLIGFLFYQSLIGTDPVPYRFPYPLRLICLMIALASHSFFAIALMSSDVVIAADFYGALDRSWWPDLLREQTSGASFAWAFGELPGVLVMLALLLRWSRDDERKARQLDRVADRNADAELAAYNQMLEARSRGSPSREV